MELWITFSLLAAFLSSFTNIITKSLSSKLDYHALALSRNAFSLPILWSYLIWKGFPNIDITFWLIIVIMLPIKMVATIMFFRSIQISPISLITPLLSFNPFFIALFAFFILNESLSNVSFIAMILLFAGTYTMHMEYSKLPNLLLPLKRLGSNQGSLLAIGVSILWGTNLPLGKLAIQYSSIEFFTTVFFSLLALFYFPIFLLKSNNNAKHFKNNILKISLMGLFNALLILTSRISIALGPTAVISSIISLSTLFTVIFAGAFLKEKNIIQTFIAATLMTAGAILIILFR